MQNFLKPKSSTRFFGFTIVEVTIVLAVAGLIMLIVFQAVPQLQRNSRDNARKNIVLRFKSEMEAYQANNQGTYPFAPGDVCKTDDSGYATGSWQDFYCKYVANSLKSVVYFNDKDPSTDQSIFYDKVNNKGAEIYAPKSFSSSPAKPAPTSAEVIYGAKCSGADFVASGSSTPNTKKYVIIMGLENSGSYFCIDNE